MDKIKTILLFGSPGSGKGTQGKLLGILPGFHHLACGNVFRSIDLSSEVGKVFLQYSSKGELVPDDFTVRLWREHIDKLIHTGALNPSTSVLVLDGIPRNIHQAKMLDQYIDLVLLFCLPRLSSDLSRPCATESPPLRRSPTDSSSSEGPWHWS